MNKADRGLEALMQELIIKNTYSIRSDIESAGQDPVKLQLLSRRLAYAKTIHDLFIHDFQTMSQKLRFLASAASR